MKDVKISYDLFCKLIFYFFADRDDLANDIMHELEDKANRLKAHADFTKELRLRHASVKGN
jgi:hypothetical protein